MILQGADQDALLQLMQKEAKAGNGTGGLGRGVDVDAKGETVRLLKDQDINDDTFPVLIWKFVQHINPF